MDHVSSLPLLRALRSKGRHQRPALLALGVVLTAACGQTFSSTNGGTGAGGTTSAATTTGTTTSGTTATSGSTTGSASAGGTSATSSSTSTGPQGTGGGASGTPCTPGSVSACAAGNYCEAVAMTCTACSDLSRLQFAKPAALNVTLPGGTTNATTPRIGTLNEMLFVYTPLVDSDIGAAESTGALAWGAGKAEASNINSTTASQSGPLLIPAGKAPGPFLPTGVTGALPVLYFNRSSALGTSDILAINPAGAASGTGAVSAVSLGLGSATTSVSNLALAYKASPPRAWYVTGSGVAPPVLVTATEPAGAATVSIALDNNCPAQGDLTPWVTPDGTVMFFASKYPETAGCTVSNTATSGLYYASLDLTGQQKAGTTATAVFESGGDDATPSLSPDLCILYFARTTGSQTALYAALRE